MDLPSGAYSAIEDFERRYVRPKAGRTLVVGSRVYPGRADRRQRYEQAEGWDALPGDGVDKVVNLEQALPLDAGLFSHIDCISVLEHSRRPWLLAEKLVRLLEWGGSIYVQVPLIWRPHAYPSDLWRFTIEGVRELFAGICWTKMLYAHLSLTEETQKLHGTKVAGFPYFARTEVCAFGLKQDGN